VSVKCAETDNLACVSPRPFNDIAPLAPVPDNYDLYTDPDNEDMYIDTDHVVLSQCTDSTIEVPFVTVSDEDNEEYFDTEQYTSKQVLVDKFVLLY
jgi:hypothetical protein